MSKNIIWHDIEEKPLLDQPILIVMKGKHDDCRAKYRVGVYAKRGNDYPLWIINGGYTDSFVEKWAYIYDLLNLDFMQEEPVSEDLSKAAIDAADDDMQGRQIMESSHEDRMLYSRIFRRGFKAGAEWQKAKDQETIELAEDHAMLAGMEKMKEQMMKDAVGGLWIRRNKHTKTNVLQCFDVTHEVFQKFKDGDRIKMLILKDE